LLERISSLSRDRFAVEGDGDSGVANHDPLKMVLFSMKPAR
jgi:hypothetical protein